MVVTTRVDGMILWNSCLSLRIECVVALSIMHTLGLSSELDDAVHASPYVTPGVLIGQIEM